MKIIALLFLIAAATFTQGRHIKSAYDYKWDAVEREDVIPMNVLFNVKLNRFVPINNALFFKLSEPCEQGFKRDAIGVCREVWD